MCGRCLSWTGYHTVRAVETSEPTSEQSQGRTSFQRVIQRYKNVVMSVDTQHISLYDQFC